ncbi:MAG: hypothetical protein AAGC60_04010 [Acidobacteriota bacterium]
MLQRILVVLGVLALCIGTPGFGQPIIEAGTDVWETGDGTFYDFAADPLPANFFCQGSQVFKELIKFSGVPVITNPPGVAGNGDTIVERFHDVDLSGGAGVTDVAVRAMSLRGQNLVTVFCDSGPQQFEVRACTCGEQPITQIRIEDDGQGCGCGTFSGSLALNVCISFTNVNTGAVVGPVQRPVILNVDKNNWCDRGPGSNEIANAYHVGVDCPSWIDCSDRSMIAVSPTSNFHPGWSCDTVSSGLSCLDLFGDLTTCHSSFGQAPHEHCVNPVCCGRKGQPCPQ